MKKGILIPLLLIFLLASVGLAGPAKDIAEKMAPRDATGDLEKVQGESEPMDATPTPRAVESISEVQLLTLPRGKPIKKESEEPEKPMNLLDDPQVRRLLKPNPDFTYDPRDLKDPMIVPWVRHALLIKEFLETVQTRIKQRKIAEANSIIKQIEELLPDITDIELRKNAEAQLAIFRQEIEKLNMSPEDIQAMATPQPIQTPRIVMPTWIKTHVGGVIWQPSSKARMALIGDEILYEGQAIPKYPEAVVQKINPSSVVISYRGITEEIPVEKEE